MTLKQQVHQYCKQLLEQKLQYQQQVLADLRETGANETKSTAGDKHETALAMVQIEQANMRGQLQQTLQEIAFFDKLQPLAVASIVANGSLVKTNKGYFYISVGLGKAVIDNITIFILSPNSPLGQQLMGTTLHQSCTINNQMHTIEAIW
jgi:hypothetical protein